MISYGVISLLALAAAFTPSPISAARLRRDSSLIPIHPPACLAKANPTALSAFNITSGANTTNLTGISSHSNSNAIGSANTTTTTCVVSASDLQGLMASLNDTDLSNVTSTSIDNCTNLTNSTSSDTTSSSDNSTSTDIATATSSAGNSTDTGSGIPPRTPVPRILLLQTRMPQILLLRSRAPTTRLPTAQPLLLAPLRLLGRPQGAMALLLGCSICLWASLQPTP